LFKTKKNKEKKSFFFSLGKDKPNTPAEREKEEKEVVPTFTRISVLLVPAKLSLPAFTKTTYYLNNMLISIDVRSFFLAFLKKKQPSPQKHTQGEDGVWCRKKAKCCRNWPHR
jgi:hypothetical protein